MGFASPKKAMPTDPYATLGVARTASTDEIKAAYRKLAKDLHPDLNPGNKAAEKRFKEVAAAYEILSDPEKKAKFDRGESEEAAHEAPHARRYYYQTRGPGSAYHQDFSFEDVFGDLFARAEQEQRNIEVELPISLAEAVLGGSVHVRTPSGEIVLRIPPGVSSGQKLRIRGKGRASARGGERGDVIAVVKIVMPSQVDDELREKIEEWSRKHPYNPRARGSHAA